MRAVTRETPTREWPVSPARRQPRSYDRPTDMPQNLTYSICAICGERKAVTRDHVPPKGIFPAPRPSDLIAVPSCVECNNGASSYDRRFRACLSLHVGIDDPITSRLWRNHALPRLRRDHWLRSRILSQIEPVWLTTPEGVIFETGFRFPWDSEAHHAVIERTIRGLYFRHAGAVLGRRGCVKVQWFRALNDSLIQVSKDWQQCSLGGGQFVYRFAIAVDDPVHSLWLFQFHGRHWAGGYTEPVSEDNGLAA